MTDLILLMLGLAVLLPLDLLVVTARASLLQTSLARLLAQRSGMEPQTGRTLALLHSLPRLQASLDLAHNLLRFLLVGWLLYFVFRYPATASLSAATGILLISAVLVYWLQWAIEGFVLRDSAGWALRITPFAHTLMFVLTPLVIGPLSLTGEMKPAPEGAGLMTADELRTLVDAGQEDGLFEQEERKMIYSIFNLGNTLAREIMIPRIDIVALEVSTPALEAVEALLKSGNSRLPVYEETVDHVLGLLYAKDLLRVWQSGEQLDSLRSLLRPAYFIPEAKKVDQLLAEMQRQRIHLAMVVDEYGGIAGLVTLEDIVEEILGEIQDEYDQGEESPYQELAEGKYVFQGRVDLDDFNEIFASSLPKDEADTIGGLVYSRLGRVPSSGEQLQVEDLLLTVEQVSGRRIRKVRAERIPTASQIEKKEETHVDG